MIPRATTVGTLKTYRYDLNRSSYTMNQSMNRVITQRNFNSFAEDPAIASRCFQLRRSYLRTSTQLTLNNSVYSKYQQAWDALDGVSSDIARAKTENQTAFASILRSENDADASGRNALGQVLVAKADSIVQTMNGRFGENFIFAGADTLNVPFTWSSKQNPDYIDPETLDPANPDHAAAYKYYAFADPDHPDPDNTIGTNDISDLSKVVQDPVCNPARDDPDYDDTLQEGDEGFEGRYYRADGNGTTDDLNLAMWTPRENPTYDENVTYKYLKNDGTGTNDKSEAARALYYRGVAVDENDSEKMNYYLKEETKYMDLGLGYQERNGEVVSSSVFDASLQGVFYLGNTGTTVRTAELLNADGTTVRVSKEVEVPNNIVSVIDRLGQILIRCDPDNGAFASEDDELEARALAQQFEDVMSICSQRYDELDTQSGFLKGNGELLTKNCDTLSQQFMALEDVDPAAAISDFMYARYCYDTALKVGNSILSQSLMDYMSL